MCPRDFDTDIPIESILVTQSSIRVFDRVRKMVDFVVSGGRFTSDRVAAFHEGELNRFGLIVLSRFPGDLIYLHDGHHRSVSAYLGGRRYFSFEERIINEWDSLDRYNEINPEKGWVTPLDLRTEVRLPDVLKFKQKALALDGDTQTDYIRSNRHRYATKREIHTVADMGNLIYHECALPLAA
jgi:hypothetical protein